MKFSLFSLIVATLVAALTFAAINIHGLFYILLRFVALLSFPVAVLNVIYAKADRKHFARGWAICVGVVLGLHFMRVNLVGIYLSPLVPDPSLAGVIDIDLALAAGYAGGCYAVALQRSQAERNL